MAGTPQRGPQAAATALARACTCLGLQQSMILMALALMVRVAGAHQDNYYNYPYFPDAPFPSPPTPPPRPPAPLVLLIVVPGIDCEKLFFSSVMLQLTSFIGSEPATCTSYGEEAHIQCPYTNPATSADQGFNSFTKGPALVNLLDTVDKIANLTSLYQGIMWTSVRSVYRKLCRYSVTVTDLRANRRAALQCSGSFVTENNGQLTKLSTDFSKLCCSAPSPSPPPPPLASPDYIGPPPHWDYPPADYPPPPTNDKGPEGSGVPGSPGEPEGYGPPLWDYPPGDYPPAPVDGSGPGGAEVPRPGGLGEPGVPEGVGDEGNGPPNWDYSPLDYPPWDNASSTSPEEAGPCAKDSSSLFDAASSGQLACLESLLDDGADVDFRGGEFHQTALQEAIDKGHDDIFVELLSRGAKIEAIDYDGWTALFYAARRGNADAVRKLVEAGANTQATDKGGKRAIDFASNEEVKRLLRDDAQSTEPPPPLEDADETPDYWNNPWTPWSPDTPPPPKDDDWLNFPGFPFWPKAPSSVEDHRELLYPDNPEWPSAPFQPPRMFRPRLKPAPPQPPPSPRNPSPPRPPLPFKPPPPRPPPTPKPSPAPPKSLPPVPVVSDKAQASVRFDLELGGTDYNWLLLPAQAAGLQKDVCVAVMVAARIDICSILSMSPGSTLLHMLVASYKGDGKHNGNQQKLNSAVKAMLEHPASIFSRSFFMKYAVRAVGGMIPSDDAKGGIPSDIDALSPDPRDLGTHTGQPQEPPPNDNSSRSSSSSSSNSSLTGALIALAVVAGIALLAMLFFLYRYYRNSLRAGSYLKRNGSNSQVASTEQAVSKGRGSRRQFGPSDGINPSQVSKQEPMAETELGTRPWSSEEHIGNIRSIKSSQPNEEQRLGIESKAGQLNSTDDSDACSDSHGSHHHQSLLSSRRSAGLVIGSRAGSIWGSSSNSTKVDKDGERSIHSPGLGNRMSNGGDNNSLQHHASSASSAAGLAIYSSTGAPITLGGENASSSVGPSGAGCAPQQDAKPVQQTPGASSAINLKMPQPSTSHYVPTLPTLSASRDSSAAGW